MKYIYGMRARGFSLGTFPKYGFYELVEDRKGLDLESTRDYHDYLIYDRKLTDEEVYQYELDFIKEI